ncbi:MAG TPA: VWA domain-containing protein [Candidatus Limnocylindrales bacterium]|jgi:Ca-activated chloride channel homolog|nr:VWA domain-containing protein [Candidatus Limnocylindrales bacterium]
MTTGADLLAPGALVALALLPVLALVRMWFLRRRRPAIRYSSLSLVMDAAPRSSWVRRHLPFALFLVALASLVVAMARPVQIVPVPAGRTTVILALDVSRSMCATDIPPNRLAAAESAAADFIDRQSATTQIGIVAFAGFAEIVQPPTTDQEVLLDVVESLTTGRRTAVGSAILKSLDAIAEIDDSVAPVPRAGSTSAEEPAPMPRGAYAPAIIVLLTDGASNAGPDPVEAADAAAARGVRVYTIGFGTADPNAERPPCGLQFVGNEPNQTGIPGTGGGGGGGGFRRAIDEDTLISVADATGGTYYPAESADELHDVFENLPTDLITRHEVMEISVAFVALGATLVALAILLAQAWRPLP